MFTSKEEGVLSKRHSLFRKFAFTIPRLSEWMNTSANAMDNNIVAFHFQTVSITVVVKPRHGDSLSSPTRIAKEA